jgi:hypothetical protein
MQEVDFLSYSSEIGPIRSDAERAARILGAENLTDSDVRFVDTYLHNYDAIKAKVEALGKQYWHSGTRKRPRTQLFFPFWPRAVQAHLDEPGILVELLALSDRIDATLRRFLELQGRKRASSMDQLVTSAAEVALEQEAREQADSRSSGAATPVPLPIDDWADFVAFDCPICFDRVEEREAGSRLRCGHATCRACAADVITTAVNSAKARLPSCVFRMC